MDLRLLPIAVSAWISTAIILSLGTRTAPQTILFFAAFVMLACFALLRKGSLNVQLLVVGLVLGTVIGALRVWPLVSHPIRSDAGSHSVVHLIGTVTSDPMEFTHSGGLDWASSTSTVVGIRVSHWDVHGNAYRGAIPISMFGTGSKAGAMTSLVPGTVIAASGILSEPPTGRPIAASMTVTKFSVVRAPPRYQWFAEVLRDHLHRALSGYPSAAQALVPGLALGDSSALQSDLKADMQASGLTHLVAVSGANVSLLLVLVMQGVRRRTRMTQVIAIAVVLASFVVIVRPQPSVLRASVMGVVVVVAHFLGTRSSPLPSLAFAVLGLLCFDPWLAISYGFALSVAATAGLLLFSRRVSVWMDHILPRQFPNWFAETLTVTLCAQFAVLPLMVTLGATTSLASIPANLVAVPLAAPAMLGGLFAALVSIVSIPLAHLVVVVAVVPATTIAVIARWAANQSWAIVPMPHGPFGVLVSILLIAAVIHGTLRWKGLSKVFRGKLFIFAMCFVFLLWHPPQFAIKPWPPANWVMVACDVGQGDGVVLRVDAHSAMVIDVGPDPDAMNACLTKLHVKSIPILVLTHFHADHVGGLTKVIAHRQVGQVWVSALNEPELTTRFAMQALHKRQIEPQVITYAHHARLGELDITCLWPSRLIRGQGSDPNNASVVLLVRVHGHLIMLPGDVEPPAQLAIASQVGQLNVDVLKIAHHGSRNQDSKFAEVMHPKNVIISVGQGNDYGHPAQSTIAMYQALGAKVWRTDRQGSIAVVWTGSALEVRAQNGS